MQKKATKVKVTADYHANGYLTVGKHYNIQGDDGSYFWLEPDDVGGRIFCMWEGCPHGYGYEPVSEETQAPYWDYMLKDGEGDKTVGKFKVGDRVKEVRTGFVKESGPKQGEPVDYGVVNRVEDGVIYVGFEATFGNLPCYDCEIELTQEPDQVNHPSHYNESGVECIDAIRASLGPDGFQAYCKGNCIKYLWRYQYKNGLEDLKKAQVYLKWMVESMEDTADE